MRRLHRFRRRHGQIGRCLQLSSHVHQCRARAGRTRAGYSGMRSRTAGKHGKVMHKFVP
ncbi:hypothetical protein BAA6_1561 [Bifidobacterium animalis]|nr:hypothetical protein W91_1603 [Bifidobacterium animalis subsp. lactis Bi-07]AJD34674.1 hypothetical protein BAA6_1561 [Bifidobacterium animalis]